MTWQEHLTQAISSWLDRWPISEDRCLHLLFALLIVLALLAICGGRLGGSAFEHRHGGRLVRELRGVWAISWKALLSHRMLAGLERPQ